MKSRKTSLNDNIILESENPNTLLTTNIHDCTTTKDKHYTMLPTVDLSSIIKLPNTFSNSIKNFFIGIDININPEYSNEEICVKVIKKNTAITTYIHESKPYAFKKCKNITTYFVNLYLFSVYTDPIAVSKAYNMPSIFLTPHANGFDHANLVQDFGLDRSTIREFFDGINKMYLDEHIVAIDKSYQKKKSLGLFLLISSTFLVVLLVVLGFAFHDLCFSTDHWGFWIKLAMFIFINFLLIYIFLRNVKDLIYIQPELKKYNVLSWRVQSYPMLEEYIEIWNKYIFIPRKVFVTVPPNYQYIHFLLDITTEVKLEHHILTDE
jgi:hypothetical protein